MRTPKIFLFIQLFFCLSLSASQVPGSGNFTLSGKINGKAPKELILTYTDSLGKLHVDTTKVNQGKFEFRGNINGPTLAALTGKLTSRSMSDPNRVVLFLEPASMQIDIAVDDFPAAILKGSLTHDQFQEFNKPERKIEVERKMVLAAMDSLTKSMAIQGNKNDLSDKMESLRYRVSGIYNSYNELRNQFVRTHGNSAVTAYLMPNMIFSDMIRISLNC